MNEAPRQNCLVVCLRAATLPLVAYYKKRGFKRVYDPGCGCRWRTELARTMGVMSRRSIEVFVKAIGLH